ncbi:hypothetical protein SAMN04487821_1544 [Enterococcus malodoratus]|uniref:hypothetical protein n=1 Tax=Enterococcus malodoratus TaxID=71451 RepID=UPI0008B6012E|nr:hypothetical protein [Enterococcus malodoratus]SEU02503.1 hypothetical protein SAMN04487821_1544 [Enterococcus malodoratus]
MKYVWLVEKTPNDDMGLPDIYSSKKKAMHSFKDDYEFARARGLDVEIIYGTFGVAASWIENGEQQVSLRVERVKVL